MCTQSPKVFGIGVIDIAVYDQWKQGEQMTIKMNEPNSEAETKQACNIRLIEMANLLRKTAAIKEEYDTGA